MRLMVILLIGGGAVACSGRERSPQFLYGRATQAYLHGDVRESQQEAERGDEQFRDSSPYWSWRFRILDAKAALSTEPSEDVLKLLSSQPLPHEQPELAISVLTLIGIANINIRNFTDAQRSLDQAMKLCDRSPAASCGEVFQARGLFASQQHDSESAEQMYQLSLSFARSHNDPFLEATSLLNLGNESLSQAHLDEAIDRSEAAYKAAGHLGARIVQLIAHGNIGWAYYKFGDPEKALDLFLDAGKRAGELGDFVDQGAWLTDAGYVYLADRKFDVAEQSFRRALELEKKVNSKEEIYNVERALARFFIQTDNMEQAEQYAGMARQMARAGGSHVDELYPVLVEGQIAARRSKAEEAEKMFQEVEVDPSSPVFLRWEAQHSLARLYEDEKQPNEAVHEYQAALATFEAARDSVRHQDFQLSFLTNAARIYDDYIHFLVARGKSDEALRWADYSRARTLSEGLGLLSKGALKGEHAGPPPLRAQEISQRAKGTLLFYWLGEKQSYLWAITPHKTSLFPLPPGAEIDALVQRYRKAINGPQDVLTSSEEARALYRTLIVPAQSLLAHDGKVIIIPDGSLNNLNFETLVVPTPAEAKSGEGKPAEPKPHFWIEDADVANASSLRVLGASFSRDKALANFHEKKHAPRLLLIGDSVAPSKDYPELPRAGEQMASVSRHFPDAQQRIYQHEQATPAAYLASNPQQFSHIHFVAHGKASRLSPLDSAIMLSPAASDIGSFKLYARDIIVHPLQADLVTISACYGAGDRAYSGEGLVGLAWAFLRAGAHNVIAGLWEVTDASTEQLMDRFYDELDKGSSPDRALRAAKLSLLHSNAFRNPFYWAPFQLYTGS